MENDQLKKDLQAEVDKHDVGSKSAEVAKQALRRIEELEKKPAVEQDKFISNK